MRGQISAHYPQARIRKVDPGDDPLRLGEGEQAWSTTLRADGPEYVPLRTFRDDDLLDPGSDPLIALMGALSALNEGERVVARLMLRSLGPDWSQAHMDKAHKRPGMEPREPAYTYQTKPLQMDGITMAVLGIGALAALKGYLWVQDGEVWKAALLGTVTALGLAVGGWAWHRWKKAGPQLGFSGPRRTRTSSRSTTARYPSCRSVGAMCQPASPARHWSKAKKKPKMPKPVFPKVGKRRNSARRRPPPGFKPPRLPGRRR